MYHSKVKEYRNESNRYMGVSKADFDWAVSTNGVIVHHQDETDVYMGGYWNMFLLEHDGTVHKFKSWEEYVAWCKEVDWEIPE